MSMPAVKHVNKLIRLGGTLTGFLASWLLLKFT